MRTFTCRSTFLYRFAHHRSYVEVVHCVIIVSPRAHTYSITLLLRSPRGTQSFLLLTRPKDRQASGILYSLTHVLLKSGLISFLSMLSMGISSDSTISALFMKIISVLGLSKLQHFISLVLPFFRSCDVDPALSPSHQCCGSGSGSGLDPDSMGSLNPDPDLGGQKISRKI
jgi:hypothetical protein